MLLGIGIAVLLVGTVAYVAWLVHQAVFTRSRMRRLEKEAWRRARREDREDRSRRPSRSSSLPPSSTPPKSKDFPENSDSPSGSGGNKDGLRKSNLPTTGISPADTEV